MLPVVARCRVGVSETVIPCDVCLPQAVRWCQADMHAADQRERAHAWPHGHTSLLPFACLRAPALPFPHHTLSQHTRPHTVSNTTTQAAAQFEAGVSAAAPVVAERLEEAASQVTQAGQEAAAQIQVCVYTYVGAGACVCGFKRACCWTERWDMLAPPSFLSPDTLNPQKHTHNTLAQTTTHTLPLDCRLLLRRERRP